MIIKNIICLLYSVEIMGHKSNGKNADLLRLGLSSKFLSG